MKAERIAELKALCEKATAGPWCGQWVFHALRAVRKHFHDLEDILVKSKVHPTESEADCDFIVASRQALPELLAEVERLTNALEQAILWTDLTTSKGEPGMWQGGIWFPLEDHPELTAYLKEKQP